MNNTCALNSAPFSNINLVKSLREKTGAPILFCRDALAQTNYNFEAALSLIKTKSVVKANSKSNRNTTCGIIETYIHAGSKIGVLVELKCETDFVARQNAFKQLAKDIALQIACSDAKLLYPENFSKNDWKQELETNPQLQEVFSKPKSFKIKKDTSLNIVKSKFINFSIAYQAYISNPEITIESLINKHISMFDENIFLSKFEKFVL